MLATVESRWPDFEDSSMIYIENSIAHLAGEPYFVRNDIHRHSILRQTASQETATSGCRRNARVVGETIG